MSRKVSPARGVLSLTGKLWNVTFVFRAGTYSVWQLWNLAGSHDRSGRDRTVLMRLGIEFDSRIGRCKWATQEE